MSGVRGDLVQIKKLVGINRVRLTESEKNKLKETNKIFIDINGINDNDMDIISTCVMSIVRTLEDTEKILMNSRIYILKKKQEESDNDLFLVFFDIDKKEAQEYRLFFVESSDSPILRYELKDKKDTNSGTFDFLKYIFQNEK